MPAAWRIVRQRRAAAAFTGEGARLYGGRWSSPGRRVIYVSEHQSTAALEIFVHAFPFVPGEKYQAFRLAWADSLTEIFPTKNLPARWRSSPPPPANMEIGDRWLRERRSVALALPSAISPADTNFLLNPEHSNFHRVRITAPIEYEFDPRLLGR